MRPPQALRATLLLALAYAALGGLGLAMAIPPGYASPIFPAAGLALAATLCSGRRLLPGVWLGSFALNVSLALWQGHLSMVTVATAAGIGMGALLQAALGEALIRRARRVRWESLLTERESLVFLALGGPAACLVSASIGTATLITASIIAPAQAGFNWWNWYVGDTIGVLVCAPLACMWLMRDKSVWHDRLRTVGGPILIVLVAITAVFYATARWESETRHNAIENHGKRLTRLLENRFVAHREILASLARLLETQPELPVRDFAYLTDNTLRANTDISALSYNLVVDRVARPAFEARMAALSGRPGFRITERDAGNQLVAAGERPRYVSVGYIAPLADNAAALGFDILSEPTRAAAIAQATSTGAMALTAPIRLVQGRREQLALLALTPAYRREAGVGARTPFAFAVAVLKIDQLVHIATHGARLDGIAFELRDDHAPEGRRQLYHSAIDSPAPPAGSWHAQLALDEARWTLTVYPTTAYLEANRPWIAWLVGVGGMLLATVLQTLMFGMTGRTATVKRVVEQQTAEIRRKNAALAQNEELMRDAMEVVGEGFVIYDPDDRLVYCNDRYRELYRCSAEMIRPGERFEDILRHGAEHGQYLDAVGRVEAWIEERLAAHRSGSTDLVQALGDGRWLHVRERKTATGYIVGFRVDVTELFEAKQAAERANQAKSQFLATMSHELRTPLNGVLGMAQLLQMPGVDEAERSEYVQVILDSGNTLLTLLNDILDLSKIEAGHLELRPTCFDPAALIEDGVALFAADARQKRLQIDAHWHGARGHCYRGDATRIRQMLTNLVSNALKFTEHGSVHVGGEECARGQTDALLRFTVTDTGTGIAGEQMPRLFQPFSQVDGSSTRRFGGTGLGLSIVRRLARMMGGDAGVDSTEGVGSCFWFTVSVELTDAPAPPAPSAPRTRAEPPPPAHRLVLIVEDNTVNQRVIASMLARNGIGVTVKHDGQQAVDAVCSGAIAPDAIFMDCQMPIMDGFDAARRIREWEATGNRARTPIIALTASAFAEDKARCQAAGMDDYLSKPVNLDRLNEVVARWIETAPRPQPAPATTPPPQAATASIDLPSLKARYDNDAELIQVALGSYLDEWASLVDALARSIAAGDSKEAHRHAHSLKSVAATISGNTLSEQARVVESAAREGDLAQAAELLDAIARSARQLAEAARTLQAASPARR